MPPRLALLMLCDGQWHGVIERASPSLKTQSRLALIMYRGCAPHSHLAIAIRIESRSTNPATGTCYRRSRESLCIRVQRPYNWERRGSRSITGVSLPVMRFLLRIAGNLNEEVRTAVEL